MVPTAFLCWAVLLAPPPVVEEPRFAEIQREEVHTERSRHLTWKVKILGVASSSLFIIIIPWISQGPEVEMFVAPGGSFTTWCGAGSGAESTTDQQRTKKHITRAAQKFAVRG